MLNKIALGLILLFELAYATGLNRTIQYDEAYTLTHYAVNPAQALLAYTTPNNHLLNSLLEWATTSVFGPSRLAIRLPAFLAALAGLWLAYRLAAKLVGPAAGIAALILLGTAYYYADCAVNGRGYALSVALTLALFDLLLYPGAHAKRWLMLTGMALVLTLPSMLLLIGPLWLWLMARRNPESRLQAGALALGVLAGSFFYMPALARGWAGASLNQFGLENGASLNAELNVWLLRTPGENALLMLGIPLAILGLRHTEGRRFTQALAVTLIGGALLTAGQFIGVGRLFYGRNYLYLLGPLAVGAAAGLAWLGGSKLALSGAGLALMGGLSLLPLLSKSDGIDQVLDAIRQADPANCTPILTDCCADEPLRYELGRLELMHPACDSKLGKQVLAVASQYVSLPTLAAWLHIPTSACREILKSPPYEVYVCLKEA